MTNFPVPVTLPSICPAALPHSIATANQQSTHLVVIDPIVDQPELLVAAVLPQVTLLQLDSQQDSIAQISALLQQQPHLRQVSIVGHGFPGGLQLGNREISLATLPQMAAALRQWFRVPQDSVEIVPPQLSLYACHVGQGDAGAEFLEQLHQITGATVRASQQTVGKGNWQLEVEYLHQAGITAEVPFDVVALANYEGQLASTQRVSVASDGTQGNWSSGRIWGPSISGDGRYVAFESYASNLVPGDTNHIDDVFVYDRQTSTTQRVSVASNGTQGNSTSYRPSISADGRYVAFQSGANNLVPGDTNNTIEVFVYDRQTSTTQLVSIASDSTQGNSYSGFPSISGNGRYVAFYSEASDLVPGDTNGCGDVFIYDRQTSTTQRVSVASNGTQGNSTSSSASISADGRYVSFTSYASNLVPGDTNSSEDVFVYDRQTNTTQLISVALNGTPGGFSIDFPSISGDGRYVAFQSGANNLVSGDTNNTGDIFVYDRQTNIMQRVSVASDGTQGNNSSWSPSISADGRYVSFASWANNLVFGDTNNTEDIFVYDRQTNTTQRLSVKSNGGQGNRPSFRPSISADGQYVSFTSSAILVPEDTNQQEDVYVRDTAVGVVPYRVTNTNDSGTGSLRWAIANANAAAGVQTITFAASLFGETLTLSSGELRVRDSLIIDGDINNDGIGDITVSRDAAASQFRIFNIDDRTASTSLAVTIDGLTITGGSSTRGGGLSNLEDLTLINAALINNSATNGSALFNGGTAFLINTSISGGVTASVSNQGLVRLKGSEADETLNGTKGKDEIDGLVGIDAIYGQGGNDILLGGSGNDRLYGQGGNDILLGGSGRDRLIGGVGADQFSFSSSSPFTPTGFGIDTVADFTASEDKIVLSRSSFTQLSSVIGNGFSVSSEFAVVDSDTAAGSSSSLIVYNSSNGKLFYNRNGAAEGLGSGGQFATLSGNPALAANDFVIQA